MNSNDPLAQLRDIHLPAEIGLWPLAWGWWVLLTLIVMSISAAVFILLQKRRRNQYRHAALTLLRNLWKNYQSHHDSQHYLAELTRLLRRTALAAYPTYPLGALSGEYWLRFLDACNPTSNSVFYQGEGKEIISLPYQQPTDKDLSPLHCVVEGWVKNHLRNPSPQVILRIFSDSETAINQQTGKAFNHELSLNRGKHSHA